MPEHVMNTGDPVSQFLVLCSELNDAQTDEGRKAWLGQMVALAEREAGERLGPSPTCESPLYGYRLGHLLRWFCNGWTGFEEDGEVWWYGGGTYAASWLARLVEDAS